MPAIQARPTTVYFSPTKRRHYITARAAASAEAKAMQAAATNPAGADGFTFEQRAEWAYQQADAMLAARESA